MGSRLPRRVTLSTRSFLSLLLIQILVVLILAWPSFHPNAQTNLSSSTPAVNTATLSPAATGTATAPAATQPATTAPQPLTLPAAERPGGWLALSLNDGGYAHLFAYHPQYLPLTRLSNHPWDDLDPAVSPDGTTLAYSSRQNGYWDLYLLDLASGQTRQLTDTAEFDGSPSWSPDGTWLAYETLRDNNLEIYILSVTDPTVDPIPLTQDAALDSSPAWAPDPGRKIAFVSNRAGEDDIWVADLDASENRFQNLTPTRAGASSHPTWSDDGLWLTWATVIDGISTIYRWDSQTPTVSGIQVGSGHWPAWSPDGSTIGAALASPNGWAFTAYSPSGQLLLPAAELPNGVHGVDWTAAPLPGGWTAALAGETGSLWQAVITPNSELLVGRSNVAPLEGVSAPYPYLHDQVDEAFTALRARLEQEMGWDFLAGLENAYLPLTEPLGPGFDQDWLYTGRAFAFNPVAMNAGWVVAVREDFSGQTYWRVYIKARYQDGSQGMPLRATPWDLTARYLGDPQAYEQGGRAMPTIPGGYWIDLTDLAARYSWQRLPALVNWRTYFAGTRFNEFVITGGLDWHTAFLQLYPSEALHTATPLPLVTRTATPTPRNYKTRVPTETPNPTSTTTRRPTWTPMAP